jgi:hypothetical protein
MHWRTFQRLVDEHERFAEAAVNSAVPLQKLAELDV